MKITQPYKFLYARIWLMNQGKIGGKAGGQSIGVGAITIVAGFQVAALLALFGCVFPMFMRIIVANGTLIIILCALGIISFYQCVVCDACRDTIESFRGESAKKRRIRNGGAMVFFALSNLLSVGLLTIGILLCRGK